MTDFKIADAGASRKGNCCVEGCDRPIRQRKMCVRHYFRWKRNGDPLAGRAEWGTDLAYINDVLMKLPKGSECAKWTRQYEGLRPNVAVDGKTLFVSRYVCELTHGPAPSRDHEACHRCNNYWCVNPTHLEWDTRQGNMRDRLGNGTWGFKLTEDDARVIVAAQSLVSAKELSETFGVTERHIRKIWKGEKWDVF